MKIPKAQRVPCCSLYAVQYEPGSALGSMLCECGQRFKTLDRFATHIYGERHGHQYWSDWLRLGQGLAIEAYWFGCVNLHDQQFGRARKALDKLSHKDLSWACRIQEYMLRSGALDRPILVSP
jgi:hypothetical protein